MEEPNQIKTPAQVIGERGASFAVGFDTTRVWATGVPAFVNGEFTMLVFREQILAQADDGSPPDTIIRNVASVVMPTATMREFYQLAGPLLGITDGNK